MGTDLKRYYSFVEEANKNTGYTVGTGIAKTYSILQNYYNVVVSISGGSDSDDMLDVIEAIRPREEWRSQKITYVWFDTGLEMDATKKHLAYLEQKYGIEIKRERAVLPVAAAVKKSGYPFYSKKFSDYIDRLQKHNFDWSDRPFNELLAEYPSCKAALRWWCNNWKDGTHKYMQSEIGSAPYLKEFMVQNPPSFHISCKCCDWAKKKTGDRFNKKVGSDISFIGVRKAEGGARSTAYKTCFIEGHHGVQHFPLFWWRSSDKVAYESWRDVTHSDAYTVYGCSRTGCSGCPFSSHFEEELRMLNRYEPKLASAVEVIFKPAYDYTRDYKKFKNSMQSQEATKAYINKIKS